jgi:hypothetical protein
VLSRFAVCMRRAGTTRFSRPQAVARLARNPYSATYVLLRLLRPMTGMSLATPTDIERVGQRALQTFVELLRLLFLPWHSSAHVS